ncbi:hypothetical protein [Desulfoluna butyratoxydans]|uniref:hypothetical protein n=1 Tax=Desulfoluna butyratoxydans TaxID=231438 RepID=UPI0015D31E4B|nr:hypothetical protein [Desulfoluna butyratoxydans]
MSNKQHQTILLLNLLITIKQEPYEQRKTLFTTPAKKQQEKNPFSVNKAIKDRIQMDFLKPLDRSNTRKASIETHRQAPKGNQTRDKNKIQSLKKLEPAFPAKTICK